MPSSLPVRALFVLIALAAIAWMALGLRSTNALQAGERIRDAAAAEGGVADMELERAQRELARARQHAPDADALLVEAELLVRAGRDREAVPLLERLVREEPENIDGWFLLNAATKNTDPERSAEAARRGRALSPLLDDR
jgi:predicted Zn-dependent protease